MFLAPPSSVPLSQANRTPVASSLALVISIAAVLVGAPSAGSSAGGSSATLPSAVKAAGGSAIGLSSFAADALQPSTGTLLAATEATADGGWRIWLRLDPAESGTAPTGRDLIVEGENQGGGRDTLGRFTPGDDDRLLGLCALRERGRIAVPGVYQVEQVAPRVRSHAGMLALTAAWHSRLGWLASDFIAAGGPVEFTVGDSLALTYAPAADPVDGPAWYLVVRRMGNEPVTPLSRRPVSTEPVPQRFALHAPEPNPTANRTLIHFDLPIATRLRLEVFDLLGRRVASLVDGDLPAGTHAVTWDLRDAGGATVPPGIYVCRLIAGEFRARSKVAVRL